MKRVPTLDSALVTVEDDRLQELVGFVLLVTFLNSIDDVVCLLAFALNETVDCDLDTLPALIAVHCVVTADDGRDLTDLLLLNEFL